MASLIHTVRRLLGNPSPRQFGPVTIAIRTMRAAHGGQ